MQEPREERLVLKIAMRAYGAHVRECRVDLLAYGFRCNGLVPIARSGDRVSGGSLHTLLGRNIPISGVSCNAL